jgi:hypothetical protein
MRADSAHRYDASPRVSGSRARTARTLAGYGAALAITPYIALKVAWVAGIPWGWENAEVISGAPMVIGDAVTGAMALVGALIALAFTHRWGLRAPAWLVVFPAWVGTGLLLPIVAAMPLYGLLVALGRLPYPDAEGRASWWMFPLVYCGFYFLGIGLLVSGGFYVSDRWGHGLRGAVGDGAWGATRSLQRVLARAAAALAVCLGALHLGWALGGTFGLDPERLSERDHTYYQGHVVGAVAATCAAVGVLMLTSDGGRRLRIWIPVALAGLGSAVTFATGTLNLAYGWVLTATGGIGNLSAQLPTPQQRAVYDIVNSLGVFDASLIGVIVLFHLAERYEVLTGAEEGKPLTRHPEV